MLRGLKNVKKQIMQGIEGGGGGGWHNKHWG